jgi:hypothetical protein
MASVHEQLSNQFYRWESRGRGWQVFGEPVYPEPPFQPFRGHYLPAAPVIDDGRRPSLLSSFFGKTNPPPTPPVIAEDENEPEAHILIRDSLVELQTSLPAKLDISREAFDQFLSNLSLCREPIGFEVLGVHGQVFTQFAASEGDISQVRRQLQAHFPEATFLQRTGTLDAAWESCDGDEVFAVEFGLEREFMFPLASGKIDPFIGIVGALAELQPGELGLFQVLFQPVQHPWADSIMRSVTHTDGKPFFVNSPELTAAAGRKVQRPLFAAVVRIMARTATRERLIDITRDLAGSLRVFAQPQGNALIPLQNEGYPFENHIEDVLLRQTRRSGMLLNSDELFGFVHLPASAVRSPVLLRDAGKTKAVPSIACQSQGILIGENFHAGQTTSVRLNADQRVRHTHIIGASGTGKSTLLFNLLQQDIQNGEGLAVLDPHGDLIDRILAVIPENRIHDVVLVDLSDADFPVGFNILSAHSDLEKNLLASDLVSVFRRLATSWGDQMDTVLQNSILAFLESSRGGTLSDLRRFLNEPPYRAEFLKTVQDPEVRYYWEKVFPQLSGGKSIGPVLTRLQDFFSQKPLRNMVSQPENKLDFADIMDSGKIFLAKLPEGLCGEENIYLLGALLMSKFQQIAMSRQAQKLSARRDFWLYIDEFGHFITPSMAKILEGVRKYRLGLTLAHQDLHQLQGDPKVASAVATHPCTRIVFQVSDDDAKKLSEGFSFFDAQSLKSLGKFQAIARVERSDFDFNLQVQPLTALDDGQAEVRRQAVIDASRARYATPRAKVEALLLANLNRGDGGAQPAVPQRAEKPVAETPSAAVQPLRELAPELPKEIRQIEAEESEDETEHRALKNKISIEAEGLDYTVTQEEAVPSGRGRVDVVVRRGNRTVACEISVKCPVKYEVGNIHKCLAGGFAQVAFISANRRKYELVRQLFLETATGDQAAKVTFYAPDEFISKLNEWACDDPQGAEVERGKPRKRKISIAGSLLSDEERRATEKGMLQHIKEAMKQNKMA